MKKLFLIILLIAMTLLLTACDDYPYVEIYHGCNTETKIPIGSCYHLTKQIFTIDEHKDGYDIIIHVKAGEEK